ncbi:MAG: FAD-dependent oxidoreductase [Gammaproteobacteria bacterium]
MMSNQGPRRIAVIGGGIAGLGAAWALAARHRVTLYDSASRFGGHACTVDVDDEHGPVAVDTGFIVYNERNYAHLVRLFGVLGVPTAASDMSFAVSLDGGRVEYSGGSLNGLFAQRRNTLRPRFWRMLRDIHRFYRDAPRYQLAGTQGISIGALLAREGYTDAFIDDHLVPMAAAIWSASRADIRDYPAAAFIRFFDNHGLLSVSDRPQWRTVTGGSREYVTRLLAATDGALAPACAVQQVIRGDGDVTVVEADGHRATYDDVVIAAHADQALALLGDADAGERAVLGAFGYSRNVAWLHEDTALMPQRRAAWSSWNYLHDARKAEATPLCVSYWMNRLQPLATRRELFVTLNPFTPPDAARVHGRFDYEHPIFTTATTQAQHDSQRIQGRRRTWFCGAWLGHGFHEDGLQSGLWVAGELGAPAPWAAACPFDRLPASYLAETARAA